jgi:hypothetical protein
MNQVSPAVKQIQEQIRYFAVREKNEFGLLFETESLKGER